MVSFIRLPHCLKMNFTKMFKNERSVVTNTFKNWVPYLPVYWFQCCLPEAYFSHCQLGFGSRLWLPGDWPCSLLDYVTCPRSRRMGKGQDKWCHPCLCEYCRSGAGTDKKWYSLLPQKPATKLWAGGGTESGNNPLNIYKTSSSIGQQQLFVSKAPLKWL